MLTTAPPRLLFLGGRVTIFFEYFSNIKVEGDSGSEACESLKLRGKQVTSLV